MIEKIGVVNLIDGYKADHRPQYPVGTERVYSNMTPRKSRVEGVNAVLSVGMNIFIKEYLIDRWNNTFFSQPKDVILRNYKRRMDNYLGKDAISVEHIGELHDLGYLPIEIKSMDEGTLVPIGVPIFTIENTKKEFFWLTNYMETLVSNIMWKPITSATTAYQYRKRFNEYADITGYDKSFIQWQGHDFSFRGMSGTEDALLSASAHLMVFTGTDTIPAIDLLEMFYHANSDLELVGGSVPATEHSVMCMGDKESEINTFRRLINVLYPKGIVSIVSDTWDFWKVITEYLPELKQDIMTRGGEAFSRLVIRPDSGDPVKIITGWTNEEIAFASKTFENNACGRAERLGAFESLWNTFGGIINAKGYKELNSKIGLIYGDAISLEKQLLILSRLEAKGFSANNLVLGLGSYTYEYVTRDTYGFAMKATWGMVNGVAKEIFKDPKTDRGFKKSAKGLLMVYRDENGDLKLKDQCTREEEQRSLLTTTFKDGVLYKDPTLSEIRGRIDALFVKQEDIAEVA